MASEPPLAVLLDAELTTAKLADAEMTKLKSMRAQIASLGAKKQTAAAREPEEKAMLMLGFGYSKAWTACGPGSFLWIAAAAQGVVTPGC
jgi:hypothetical protein